MLDGELVHNPQTNKSVFVAFDIFQYKNDKVMSARFLERLTVLRDGVMTSYRKHTSKLPVQEHLELVMKSFYPRTKIIELFRYIRAEGRHRVFEHENLHHKTDGVIFQPDLPYTSSTDTNLLKWKWSDIASVDLRVDMFGREMKLYAGGYSNSEVDISKSVHLSEQDRARLVADFNAERNSLVIAEVALDPGTGLWVYMNLRPDKNKPNFIVTVMSTMMEVAEGLSEEELKYRMLSETPSSDDWATQEKNMRKLAVKYKYGKRQKLK